MKAILLVADGMGDRPVPQLKGQTPLEVADTINLDWLAEHGICGILDPIAPGIPPGSDTANLALLGYDATKVYRGRGALEALGAGVDIRFGDVAFRCNFATVDENLVVVDRRAGRIATEDASKLAEALQGVKSDTYPDVQIIFKNTVQHRAVLVLRGTGLSTAVTDTDPGEVGLRVKEAHPKRPTLGAKTATIVNELLNKFHQILKEHPVNQERVKRGLLPANIILCRGAGALPEITPLASKYGIKAAAISAIPLVRGVARAAGLKLIEVPGATGSYDTDFMAKAKAAVKAIEEYDFLLLHVKATDIASHDRKIQEKIRIIEKIDKMVGYMLDNLNLDETYIAVTSDHTTALTTGKHEGDPVPVVIYGPEVRVDGVRRYNETDCARGGLCRIRAMELMPIIMNLLGKVEKFGS